MTPALTRFREAKALLGWQLAWVGPLWLACPRFLVLTRDLTAPLPPAPHRPDLRWTTLAEPDVPRLAAMDHTLALPEIRRRLGEGQECHLCWLGESLAHYRWEARGPAYLPFVDLTLRPLPGDVCGTWSFTHPAFCASGIHTATTLAALHRLQACGLRRTTSLVAWWNVSALRVTRDRAARDIVGAVGYWRLGRRRWHFGEGAVRLQDGREFFVAAAASEP